MTVKKRPKCRTCGGDCGKKKGQPCQYEAKAAKRQSDELWARVTGGRRAKP